MNCNLSTEGAWITPTTYKRTFESFSEMLRVAASPLEKESCFPNGKTGTRYSQSCGASKDWDLDAGFAGALKLAHEGWPQGLALMENWRIKFAEQLTPSLRERQTVRYDVVGAFCDAGAFAAGIPECMMDFDTEEVEGCVDSNRVIRVSIDYGAKSWISADQCAMRGGAMLAIIDTLEAYGYRIEIVALKATESGSNKYLVEFPIKHAQDAVEPDRLAFIAAHPAMHRRIGFSTMEHEPLSVRKTFGFFDGFGNSRTSPEHADIKCPALFGHGELKTFVLKSLAQFGVLAEEAA